MPSRKANLVTGRGGLSRAPSLLRPSLSLCAQVLCVSRQFFYRRAQDRGEPPARSHALRADPPRRLPFHFSRRVDESNNLACPALAGALHTTRCNDQDERAWRRSICSALPKRLNARSCRRRPVGGPMGRSKRFHPEEKPRLLGNVHRLACGPVDEARRCAG